jgi:hypothetical protein
MASNLPVEMKHQANKFEAHSNQTYKKLFRCLPNNDNMSKHKYTYTKNSLVAYKK